MRKLHSIGILGGTFDPVHFGHLRAALEIQEQLRFNDMRLIPNKQPPHRDMPLASAIDRIEMLKLALIGTSFKIDSREMERNTPSYTVDTLMTLRDENPTASLCLIVALDAFLKLPTWHEWEKIIQLANIVVVPRSGWTMPTVGLMADFLVKHSLADPEHLCSFTAGKIVQQKTTALDISATQIRALIQTGHSPRFLLPNNVIEYINDKALYDPARSKS